MKGIFIIIATVTFAFALESPRQPKILVYEVSEREGEAPRVKQLKLSKNFKGLDNVDSNLYQMKQYKKKKNSYDQNRFYQNRLSQKGLGQNRLYQNRLDQDRSDTNQYYQNLINELVKQLSNSNSNDQTRYNQNRGEQKRLYQNRLDQNRFDQDRPEQNKNDQNLLNELLQQLSYSSDLVQPNNEKRGVDDPIYIKTPDDLRFSSDADSLLNQLLKPQQRVRQTEKKNILKRVKSLVKRLEQLEYEEALSDAEGNLGVVDSLSLLLDDSNQAGQKSKQKLEAPEYWLNDKKSQIALRGGDVDLAELVDDRTMPPPSNHKDIYVKDEYY